MIWLVVVGEMTPKCRSELNEYTSYITKKRLWEQNWGGPAGGPSQFSHAS
ncbi:hypothetical protein [Streptomyces hebeiensis]